MKFLFDLMALSLRLLKGLADVGIVGVNKSDDCLSVTLHLTFAFPNHFGLITQVVLDRLIGLVVGVAERQQLDVLVLCGMFFEVDGLALAAEGECALF